MFSILVALSLVALVSAADTVVPVGSSQVDVRQSGAEFSYNIQENRGVAAISDSVPIVTPSVKSVPIIDTVKEGHDGTKVQARAHMDLKESKKPSGDPTVIAHPFIAPLEYVPIFTHPGYTIPALPKASLIAPFISTMPAIPYPYTLIRNAV